MCGNAVEHFSRVICRWTFYGYTRLMNFLDEISALQMTEKVNGQFKNGSRTLSLPLNQHGICCFKQTTGWHNINHNANVYRLAGRQPYNILKD